MIKNGGAINKKEQKNVGTSDGGVIARTLIFTADTKGMDAVKRMV